MEHRRYVKTLLLIFLSALSAPVPHLFVFAYESNTTHPALTKETALLFSETYPALALSDEDTELLIRGSIDEDDGTRALKHFYDPVYDRGITLFGITELSAKAWAEDTVAQASYRGNVAALPLGALSLGTVRTRYSSDTDYSWERAVYEYAWGDKSRGLLALGHVLHLVQDAHVPAHTRNDPHPPLLHFGSPYEEWTGQFTQDNWSMPAARFGPPVPAFSSLGRYFDSSAQYSNGNFFSKDTIVNVAYEKPRVLYYSGDIGFYRNTNAESAYPIVRKLIGLDGTPDYTLIDPHKTILRAYWSRLSESAVAHGAGVVKLFFDEVGRERETQALRLKNRSWFDKLTAAVLGVSLVDEDLHTRAEVATETAAEAVAEMTAGAASEAVPVRLAESEITEVRQGETEAETESETSAVIAANVAANLLPDTQEQVSAESGLKTLADVVPTPVGSPYPGFGGGSGGRSSDASLERSIDGSNDEDAGEAVDASDSEDDTGDAGVETGSVPEVEPEGVSNEEQNREDVVEKEGEEQAQEAAAEAEVETVESGTEEEIDTEAGTETNAEVGTETDTETGADTGEEADEDTVSDSGTETEAESEEEGDDDSFSDDNEDDGGEGAEVEDEFAAQNDVSSPEVGEVVVNEVAWMGTAASSADEWIELYNTTDRALDLSDTILRAEDGAPFITLAGIIPAHGFYLIERSDDNTISDINAELIVPFSGEGSGSGLSNDGEHLFLLRIGSTGTTTVDEVGGCGSWCAGLSAQKRSMERVNPNTDGTVSESWETAMGEFILNGSDADGNPIFGTPKRRNSASYRIASGSKVVSDTTLTKEGSPYLVGREGLLVEEGVTLSLEQGTVVKVVPHNEPAIEVKGTIRSNGTSDEPVVFTSFFDDEYGGDTNNDGVCMPEQEAATTTCSFPGGWKHLRIRESSVESVFTHTTLRYGGRFSGGTLVVEGADIVFADSTVEYSGASGLVLSQSDSTVTRGHFAANLTAGSAGLRILGGASVVEDSTFVGNYYGISSSGSRSVVSGNLFVGNEQTAVSVSGVGGVFSENSGSDNGLNGIVLSGTVLGDSAVILSYNPLSYVLKGAVRVTADTTLSFEPSVVLKGHGSAGGPANIGRLSVEAGGTLLFNGTSTNDLVFTSLHDDSVGGETNPAATKPASDDWKGITVNAGGNISLVGFSVKHAATGLSLLGDSLSGLTEVLTNVGTALFADNAVSANLFGSTTLLCSNCTMLLDDIDGLLSL